MLSEPSGSGGLAAGGRPAEDFRAVRHELRNHLNAIKLSCALVQRCHGDEMTRESLAEIERSVAAIDEAITRHLVDAQVPPAQRGAGGG